MLNRKEAVEYLGIDEKTFDNYFKSAEEFPHSRSAGNSGRYLFRREDLDAWRAGYDWRTIHLTLEDYSLCLDFALAQHFRGYVLSDWGTGRQREFGQKVTNWIKGQLAEVAVQKFLKSEFDVQVELDFDIHNEIVPQDIIAVTDNRGRRAPSIGIGIKSSKPKSAFLVLSPNEVEIPERRSDVYIFCRPDIPDDHLLRVGRDVVIDLVREQRHFSSYCENIPEFVEMTCEIAGYCDVYELETTTSIPGQNFEGIRFVKKTGLLHRTQEDWLHLLSRL